MSPTEAKLTDSGLENGQCVIVLAVWGGYQALSSIFNYHNNSRQQMDDSDDQKTTQNTTQLLTLALNPSLRSPVQVPVVCQRHTDLQLFCTHRQHGGGFGEGGGEGPTLQLQRDGEGEQVHHSDVRKHHK